MKKVEAIVRPDRLNAVLKELSEVGYPGVTITNVKGHGKQKGVTYHWRGNEYSVTIVNKVKMEVVVLDEDVDRIVDVIIMHSRTGEIGDGKVFILDIAGAVRIRTGDVGNEAI